MALRFGRVLGGRYALGEVLGTGGMATVWQATDQVLGRDVAVKVLDPRYASDPGFLARFEREARHAARLSHPRVVTVFDCGVDDGTAFIVMELARGRTLRQVLDQGGRLPPGEAVAVAAAVCEALEAAHAVGLVHRDITPGNVMICDGEVKVLDFGIARADGQAGGTRTLGVLGTAAYLSPEQASGSPAGPASDLYSLGCVLFEMLAGTPPFTADSPVGLAYRHVHDDPGPPSARRPGLPPGLDQVTARLLAKNPADRPSSAASARAGLLAALTSGTTAVLPPAGDGRPMAPGPRRRRMTRAELLLAAALAAALSALAAVLLTGAAAGSPARSPATGQGSTRPSARHAAGPHRHRPKHPAGRHGRVPPAAAAAAAFVGDLAAGVADGQVTPQAGQELYTHLQQVLFGPPGRGTPQIGQQYTQLVQVYDQRRAQGQITGRAAAALRRALTALGTALGAG